MELYDRRTLEGVYSVRQSAGFIMNYRYAEERMMRMMAGWIALTPEIPVKLEMARQVYECVLHADALGKRLGELRSQAQVSRPPNKAFVIFIKAIEDKEQWEDTIERVTGIYRVLKPHLVAHFEEDFLKGRPHGIATGEMQAMEAGGRTLFDFPDAPWEFQLDMARQVWDESRHSEIFMRLLEARLLAGFTDEEIDRLIAAARASAAY